MHQKTFAGINWKISSFLIGTVVLSITALPLYIWHHGLDWFQVALFVFMFTATGLSITLGYHRLYAHRTFQAHPVVRLLTLLFGAAAFENSVLNWASDHRRHHKHVDHDQDPYDIRKGFFFAHMGWLLFKHLPEAPLDNVADIRKDRLAMWQHRYVELIGGVIGFGFPALLGWLWNGPVGALGGFLIAGVARVVAVQHCTFCINSLCHTLGSQPYSSKCSARDSWLMAFLTFGEGYHNFHHAFQNDYRNGVKPWHFDPTKWTIWMLSKVGLTSKLRKVSQEQIDAAELQQRLLQEQGVSHEETHQTPGKRDAKHDAAGVALRS